jgi:hypothetical protein
MRQVRLSSESRPLLRWSSALELVRRRERVKRHPNPLWQTLSTQQMPLVAETLERSQGLPPHSTTSAIQRSKQGDGTQSHNKRGAQVVFNLCSCAVQRMPRHETASCRAAQKGVENRRGSKVAGPITRTARSNTTAATESRARAYTITQISAQNIQSWYNEHDTTLALSMGRVSVGIE